MAVALSPRPVTLLDGSARRCAFLRAAAGELQDLAVLRVAEGRAEELARRPELAGQFGVVTARSFGRPAVTAECATAFLAVGGALVVSEPPASTAGRPRWESTALAQLGFASPRFASQQGAGMAVLAKVAEADTRFPRRVGVPAKRPLW